MRIYSQREEGDRVNFDQKAAGWDTEMRRRRTEILSGELGDEIDALLGTGPEALEYGCGTGLVGLSVADRFSRLTLADSSTEMIRIVREKIEAAGRTNARAISVDYTKDDNPDQDYDLIFFSMALHHVTDVRALLSVFRDAMRPDGALMIIDLYPVDTKFHEGETDFAGHHGFDPEELGRDLEALGFSRITSRRIYEDVKPVGETLVPYALFLLTARKDG